MATFRPDRTSASSTSRDDFLFGSNNPDTIFARNGADTVFALGGADEVYGEAQDDTLHGGTGDDYVNGGSGDDILHGEDGNDVMYGSTNDDQLFGGGEEDTLIGGPGSDTASGGGENDNIIWADGDGNDVVDGGSDYDSLSIFTTDEFEPPLLGESLVLEGDGDQAFFKRISADPFDQTISNVEQVEVFTAGGQDSLMVGDLTGTGVESIVVFTGFESDSVINTGSTPMMVFGEGDADFLIGGLGDDTLFTGDGNDVANGGGGNDYLTGGDGDDSLTGGAGNDTIYGEAGMDTLTGGAGNDELIGFLDADQFRYDLPDGGQDLIQDFVTGEDDLFLSGVTQTALDTSGDLLVDDADDAVSLVDNSLFIDFGGGNTLTLSNVQLLVINTDVFFV